MKLGTSTCVNYSIRNPKHSARYVYHIGSSASSTARAGTSCETEPRRTRNLSSTPWISSRFLTTTQRKGDPTGTVTGRSQGITSTTSRIRSRRNARRSSTWVSTTGSSETRSSARTCLTPVARSMCRKMDELANEDHTHHPTPEEIRGYRANWWIRSNKVGPDTMPVRHRSDFKQALSTLRQLKDQEDAAHQQRWTQSYSSSWWNWQESCWHSSYEHHHEDVPSTD